MHKQITRLYENKQEEKIIKLNTRMVQRSRIQIFEV